MTPPDPLDAILPIVRVGEVDSTMTLARHAAESGNLVDTPDARGVMFIARSQSGGVGRHGRAWHSPPGGLWATIAWPIGGGDGDAQATIEGLATRVGVACLNTVRVTLANHRHTATVTLKWPNDILINGRKVCGSLSQVLPRGAGAVLLVGVGVNTNNDPADLPHDLRRSPTSLAHEVGQPINLPRLERELRAALHRAVTSRGIDALTLAGARQSLHGVGESVGVILPGGERLTGRLTGLTEDGRPVLDLGGGEPFVVPTGADLA